MKCKIHRQVSIIAAMLVLAAGDMRAFAGAASNPAVEDKIRVVSPSGNAADWSVAKLKTTFAASIKSIEYEGKGQKHHSNCVPLIDLVKSAGIETTLKMDPKIDPKIKNYLLRLCVVVQGSDGYTATFSVGELLADIGDREAWLALDEDGQPLSDRDGPVKSIVPSDEKPGRWVRKVASVKVVDPAK